MTSPERLATIGCCHPTRRMDATTCGTAALFSLGLLGVQYRRSIGIHATVRSAGLAMLDALERNGQHAPQARPALAATYCVLRPPARNILQHTDGHPRPESPRVPGVFTYFTAAAAGSSQ